MVGAFGILDTLDAIAGLDTCDNCDACGHVFDALGVFALTLLLCAFVCALLGVCGCILVGPLDALDGAFQDVGRRKGTLTHPVS